MLLLASVEPFVTLVLFNTTQALTRSSRCPIHVLQMLIRAWGNSVSLQNKSQNENIPLLYQSNTGTPSRGNYKLYELNNINKMQMLSYLLPSCSFMNDEIHFLKHLTIYQYPMYKISQMCRTVVYNIRMIVIL